MGQGLVGVSEGLKAVEHGKLVALNVAVPVALLRTSLDYNLKTRRP